MTLQIEEGAYYLTVGRYIVGPMQEVSDPEETKCFWSRRFGEFYYEGRENSASNFVIERRLTEGELCLLDEYDAVLPW